MSLVTTVEALLKRPLSTDEVQSLNSFQKQFDVDDDDPLMVVLAMMARTQIIVEGAPNLLQQKVNETIELHRAMLRDQSVIIAKELVGVLTKDVMSKVHWTKYLLGFGAGIGFALLIVVLAKFAPRLF